jgi:hypothetical protein
MRAIAVFLAATLICAARASAQYGQRDQFELPSLDVGEDTLAAADTADTLVRPDTALVPEVPKGPKKLKIVRRAYKYREQIGLALAMMGFVVVILTSTQNWNPD